MTTLDPGASEVFTHGLTVRPRSTALRASSPAASITDGLDVLVQLVIGAMTTCPGSGVRSAARGASSAPSACTAGGSLAGNDAADAPLTVAVASCGSATPSISG